MARSRKRKERKNSRQIKLVIKKVRASLTDALKTFGPFNLLLTALTLGAIGQYFLYIQKNLVPGLIFFFFGIISFILAGNISRKDPEPEKIGVKIEFYMFLLIFAAGIFLRIYKTGMVPPGFFYDEAESSNDALSILNGQNVQHQLTSLPVYIKGAVDNPALLLYVLVAFFKIAGAGIMQARIGGAVVMGILAIPAFYFLVRRLMGPKPALIAAFLFSVMRWHITYSRLLFHAGFCVLMTILFVYFFYLACTEKKWMYFIIAGITFGLSQYTYQPVKLLLLWALIFSVYIVFMNRGFLEKNYSKFILAAFISVIILLPLLGYIIKNREDYTERIKLLSIFNRDVASVWTNGPYSAARLYVQNTVSTLLMFNYEGDHDPRHNYRSKPMLDFVTGIFAFLGFGYLLSVFLKPFPFFVLTLFFISIQGSVLNIAAPHATRAVMAAPFVIIFCAVFFQKFFQYLREEYRPGTRKLVSALAICVIACAGPLNFNSYFNGYGKDPDIWDAFSCAGSEAAKRIISLGPEWQGIVAKEYCVRYYESSPFKFVMRANKTQNYTDFDGVKSVPADTELNKNCIYILPVEYSSLVPLLKKIYPGGEYRPVQKRFHEDKISYFSFEIPRENIRNGKRNCPATGLTGYYYNKPEWKGGAAIKRKDLFMLVYHDPLVNDGILSIAWKGKIRIPETGKYAFVGESEDEVYWDILIDGKQAFVSPARRGKVFDRGEVDIARGIHDFSVRCSSTRDIQKMKIYWIPPGAADYVIIPNELLIPE